MVLPLELLPYAENIWRRFPEEFITLGGADSEGTSGEPLLERQMVVTKSKVTIRIVLRREPPAPLERTASADHSTALAQDRMPCPAHGRRSEALAKASSSHRQPRLSEVFSGHRQHRLAEVFNSKNQQEAFNSKNQQEAMDGPWKGCRWEAMDSLWRGEAVDGLRKACRSEAAGRLRTCAQPYCPRKAMGTAPSWPAAEALSSALSPSGSTVAPGSADPTLSPQTYASRQRSRSYGWSGNASAVALRRNLRHLTPVTTRPPPAPSPFVIRVPDLDRAAPGHRSEARGGRGSEARSGHAGTPTSH